MSHATVSQGWTPTLPDGQVVELAGRGTTFVRDSGPGSLGAPPLLLLHGLAASGDVNFVHQMPSLVAAGHRIITIDHRGHGRGIRPPDGRFRLADCADDAAALLDHLGIEAAVAVGYSMGGPISQLLWHRHPERVVGLVECATARNFLARGPRPIARRALPGFFSIMRAVPRDRRRALRDVVMRDRLEADDLVEWLRTEFERNDMDVVLDAARAVATFSSRPWIGGVADTGLPAVSVVTLDDRLVPARRQYGLARAMGADVVAVGADHIAVTLDPDAVTDAMVRATTAVVHRLP